MCPPTLLEQLLPENVLLNRFLSMRNFPIKGFNSSYAFYYLLHLMISIKITLSFSYMKLLLFSSQINNLPDFVDLCTVIGKLIFPCGA
jgi:hypothetical protein